MERRISHRPTQTDTDKGNQGYTQKRQPTLDLLGRMPRLGHVLIDFGTRIVIVHGYRDP